MRRVATSTASMVAHSPLLIGCFARRRPGGHISTRTCGQQSVRASLPLRYHGPLDKLQPGAQKWPMKCFDGESNAAKRSLRTRFDSTILDCPHANSCRPCNVSCLSRVSICAHASKVARGAWKPRLGWYLRPVGRWHLRARLALLGSMGPDHSIHLGRPRP